jgi:hypothetical protein
VAGRDRARRAVIDASAIDHPRARKLYDRRSDEISLDEVEKISI